MTAIDVDKFRTVLLEERQRVAGSMQYIHGEQPDNDDEMNLSTHLADNAALTLDQELDARRRHRRGRARIAPWSSASWPRAAQ